MPEEQDQTQEETTEEEDAFSAWERKWGSEVEDLDKELEQVEEEEEPEPKAEEKKDDEERAEFRKELQKLQAETARANAAAARLAEQREIDAALADFSKIAAEDPILAQLAAASPPNTQGTKKEFLASAKALRSMADTLRADREKVREEAKLEERRKIQSRIGPAHMGETLPTGTTDPQLKELLDKGQLDDYLVKHTEGFLGSIPEPED